MLGHAHAGLGWVLGAVAPGSDRRLRIWCTAAAVLPDIDALPIIAGGAAYDRLHHTFGHNLFAGGLCVLGAAWGFRRYPTRAWFTAVILVTLCFASHLLTDMKFSGWPVQLFWPVSSKPFQFHPLLPLGHWINIVLVVGLSTIPWAIAPWRQATPFEIVSERLDRLVLNFFRRKNRACSTCGRPCNNRCDRCTKPVCLTHGRLSWRFRISCPACAAPLAGQNIAVRLQDDPLVREFRFIKSKEGLRLDPEFRAFLDRKLTEGMKRLDAVPRTHAIWKGTDGKPTLAKVADLARLLLHEAPDDEEARWVLFADSVRTCSADFSAIEPLVLRDFGALHWLVAAARWNYVLSGVDPVLALRAPFESLARKTGSMQEVFRELSNDPDRRTKEAAQQCLELLGGHNPFKGHDRPLTPGDYL